MRGRGGTVPLVCCGAVTAAALAFWVYYILAVYPAGGAGAAMYRVLEWATQPAFYAALPAFLCISARRAGKLALPCRWRWLCFSAGTALLALYALYAAALLLLDAALPAAALFRAHEELLLAPGILWGLGVPFSAAPEDL